MAHMKTMLAASALGFSLIASTASPTLAGPNCTCRFAGQNFETGDIMCIRGKLSRCEFVLNNTSWKTIAETCPQTKGPDIQQSPTGKNKVTLLARMQNRFAIK